MTQRDSLLVFGAVVIALAVAALLFTASMATAQPGQQRPRFYFDRQPLPSPRGIVEIQQRVPDPFRIVVPVQRDLSTTSRDAAGYILVLLAVAGTLVVARDQVLAVYRASLGDWRAQGRVLATGLAVMGIIAAVLFLTTVVFLGSLTSRPVGPPELFPLQMGLQTGLSAGSVVLVVVGLAALVGFAAASWRLGDAILGLRPLARWSARVPAPLVALLGATLIYLFAQVPTAGILVFVAVLAYALGAVVIARLAHTADVPPVTPPA